MKTIVTAAASAVIAITLAACRMPAGDTPLAQAVNRGDAARVRSLIVQGSDPDGKDWFGLTPLARAARLGRSEVVKALLDGGADPDLLDQPPTREGWTPLMNAVHKHKKEIVRVLLAAGADPNRTTSRGMTALTLAQGDADAAIVRLLLDAGAQPQAVKTGPAGPTITVSSDRTVAPETRIEKVAGLKVGAEGDPENK